MIFSYNILHGQVDLSSCLSGQLIKLRYYKNWIEITADENQSKVI